MGNRKRQTRAAKAAVKNVQVPTPVSSTVVARFNTQVTSAGQDLLSHLRFRTTVQQERLFRSVTPDSMSQVAPSIKVAYDLRHSVDASAIAFGGATLSDMIFVEGIVDYAVANGINASRYPKAPSDIGVRPESNVGRTRWSEFKISTLHVSNGAPYFVASFSEGQIKKGRHLVMAFVTDRESLEEVRFLVIPMSKLAKIKAQISKAPRRNGVRRPTVTIKKNGSGQLSIPSDIVEGAIFDPVVTPHLMDFSAFADFVRRGLR